MSDETLTVGTSSKSPFTSAVKNIRKLIDKGQVQVKKPKGKQLLSKKKEPSTVSKAKPERRRKEKTTGSVVYLSHLPDGFEEKGIRSYLEQFGKVSGVRLVRSQKTGRSRGFAFVEFVEKDVAEIVVQTMNNYLMFKRLVKAELLAPPNDGANALQVFNSAPIKPENCRTARCREAYIKKRDKFQNLKDEQRIEAHTRRSLRRLKRKLEERGIPFEMKANRKAWKHFGPKPSVTGSESEDASLVLVQDDSDTDFNFAASNEVNVTQ